MAAIDGDLELEIACVQRELKMRDRVYAWRVREGKMSQHQATEEIRLMTAVLHRLEGLRPKDLLG